MNAMKMVPLKVPSIRTMEPPNQSNPPITPIPMNSLTGEAKFCLFNNLFEKLKNFKVELKNFVLNFPSALKALIILSPLKDSSTIDKNSPCSF